MDLFTLLCSLQEEVNMETTKTDRELFEQYFNQINKQKIARSLRSKPIRNGKSIARSEVFRVDGNSFFKFKNYAKALDMYNMSLSAAPRYTSQYGIALANRSAVLFDMGMFKECLMDMENIFNTTYPGSLYYKVFLRQSKCYLALKKFKEATTAIENARRTFKALRMNTPLNSRILKIITHLSDRIHYAAKHFANQVTIDDKDDYVLPGLKNGANPKFLGASNAVQLLENGPQGRYVTATCDIKKGDVLFAEEAYSFTVLNTHDRTINYCNHCLKFSMVAIPCTSCSKFFFCSEKCRTESWDDHHKWLCAGEQKDIVSNDMALVLRTVFRAARNGFNTTITDESTFGNSEDNYPYLNMLKATHGEDVHDRVWVAVMLIVYLDNEVDYIQWLYDHQKPPIKTREELVLSLGTLILRHLVQCSYNVSDISVIRAAVHNEEPTMISLSHDVLAMGLYVSTSLINHSCVPNAQACYENNVKWVKATESIKKGTEITVSYIVDNFVSTNKCDLQAQLSQRFGFLCTCKGCTTTEYVNLLQAWACVQCRGPAPICPDMQHAKCIDCSFEFDINEQLRLQMEFFNLYVRYEHGLQNDFGSLKKMLWIVEHIFWKRAFLVLQMQAQVISQHRHNGNLKECCNIYELLLKKEAREINDRALIGDWMKYSYTIAKYCKSIPHKLSKEYRDTYKKAIEVIKKVGNILSNYTCRRSVVEYYRSITKYLHSDKRLMQFDYSYGKEIYIQRS